MAEKKFLKQGEGRTVRQENGQPWPAEGMEADDTIYIRRRIRDEDLVEAERPAVPAQPIEDLAETAKRSRKTAETEGDAK